MFVAVINQADRLLPGILVEPMKHDLMLSDTAIGLINGFGFLIVYALLGVPIARLSDRGIYGTVIAICLSLWSLMTMLGAAAQTGLQLAFTRMGVALGESGSTPAAHAFIARNFPPTGRGAPLAVLGLSVPFASLSALMGGGLLGEAVGWRWTFVIMGAIGLVLGPVVLLVLGPRQDRPAGSAAPSLSLGPVLMLLRKPAFLLTVTATAFIGIGGYTLATFSSAFLMRVHGLSMGEVGVRYGLAVGIGGVISVLIAGFSADRMSARDPRWILWVLVLMIAICLPFAYAAFLVPNVWVAMVCMAVGNIMGTAYLAPVVAAVQRLAAPHLRATASALLMMFTALAGGAGPFITGLISDTLQAEYGPKALGRAMLVVPIAFTCAGILYALASIRFRRDMVAEDAPAK